MSDTTSWLSRLKSKFPTKGILPYIISIFIFAMALVSRIFVDPVLPPGFPFVTFFPAVIITAFLCGTGAGLLSAALGFVAAWYFFITPANSFELSVSGAIALTFYILIVAVNLIIIDRFMKATAQLRTEKALALRMAEERKTLFSEVQHRIGNNLQAVSSLLLIQSRVVGDEAARRALIESVNRVSLIAEIQRMFHDPDRGEGKIDENFVNQIAKRCIETMGLSDKFDFSATVETLTLPQDAFLAVSLVLTECISNALEHGDSPDRRSRIHVTLKRHDTSSDILLQVFDNGPGVAADFDPTSSNSIGMKIIHAFARQLDGKFAITSSQGTVCSLTFPLKPQQQAHL